MEARYRKDYTGEFVVAKSTWADLMKQQSREWIENSVDNQQISNRAAVIGSRADTEVFDFTRLARHRGGLLAKKSLQTYGCHDLWKDMHFDFIVTMQRDQLVGMKEQNYINDTAVFTNSSNCLNYPGSFYLTPFTPALDEMALAVYLAAFDGHEEVFLLGYNIDTPCLTKHWIEDVNTVIQTYSNTNFILVGYGENMPDLWRNNSNVSTMDYRSFVFHCDI